MIKRKAFTIIEIVVAIGVLAVMMVTVGGSMGMLFRGKNVTDNQEVLSSRAEYILGELKKNILDAQVETINCPLSVGDSISFQTRSGGNTSLLCDTVTENKIASRSAENGEFNLLDQNVRVKDCNHFVECDLYNGKVMSVGFSLSLVAGEDGGGVGTTGLYFGRAATRE